MKISSYIQPTHAKTVIEKSIEAYREGFPFNCFITLNIEESGISPEDASQWYRDKLKEFRRAHLEYCKIFPYVWVLENPPRKRIKGYNKPFSSFEVPSIGVHAHMLIHRSNNLPWTGHQYGSLVRRFFKIPARRGMVKITKFYTYQPYDIGLTTLIKYILKGIRPEVAKEMGIKARDQGIIYGKRIGWSRETYKKEVKSVGDFSLDIPIMKSTNVTSPRAKKLLESLERLEKNIS